MARCAQALEQRQLLGKQLYPLVQKKQPNRAGKVTDMLLNLDLGEIRSLIEAPDKLDAQIAEALSVLAATTTSDLTVPVRSHVVAAT